MPLTDNEDNVRSSKCCLMDGRYVVVMQIPKNELFRSKISTLEEAPGGSTWRCVDLWDFGVWRMLILWNAKWNIGNVLTCTRCGKSRWNIIQLANRIDAYNWMVRFGYSRHGLLIEYGPICHIVKLPISMIRPFSLVNISHITLYPQLEIIWKVSKSLRKYWGKYGQISFYIISCITRDCVVVENIFLV